MGVVKGATEYKRFKGGESLTRGEAILAMCFDCMGGAREDCEANQCPLYDYRRYKGGNE